jgi:CheY-like chemotaxis protein
MRELKPVLAVEVDPQAQDLIKKMLQTLGCQYAIKATTNEALEAMQRGIEYSILLTDLGLPTMMGSKSVFDHFAGFQLAIDIMERQPSINIIFCTGVDKQTFWDKLPLKLRSAQLLQKPINFQELQAVLRTIKK